MRMPVALRLMLLMSCIVSLAACDYFVSAGERVERARQRIAQGDSRGAAIELQNALSSEPKNLEARLLLADISVRTGNAELADKELSRAIADGATAEQTAELMAEIRLSEGKFNELLSQIDAGSIALKEPARSTYRGLALLSLQKPEPALQAFNDAIGVDPKAFRARIGLAQTHIVQGHLDGALTEIEKATAIDPNKAQAWMLRGSIYSQRGDFRAAYDSFVAARKNAPGQMPETQYDSLLAAIAECQIALGELDGARATHAELVKQSGDSPLAHFVGARIAISAQDYSAAVKEAQQVVTAAPGQAQARLLLGTALLANGSLNQAEATLAELVRQSPENSEARKLLAQTYLRLQRPDVAMQVLSPLQEAQNADPQLDALLGWANLQRGEGAAAIELLERSTAAQPENYGLKMDLALAYMTSGESDKAVALLRGMPENAGGARRQGLLIAAIAATSGTDAARTQVDRIVAEHPKDAGVLQAAALFHVQQRDFDQASQLLDRAIVLTPKDVSLPMTLARVKAAAGDFAGTKIALEKVLAIEPNNQPARVALAQTYLRRGEYDTAISSLEELRAADPKAVEARLLLGSLYLKRGKAKEGDAAIREALQVSDSAANTDAVGQIYMEAGRYEQALGRFREASAKDAGNTKFLVNAARAQIALGNIVAARESLERARSLQPDAVAPVTMLVSLDLRENRGDQALARVAQLKKAHPQSPGVAVIEGDVAMALKNNAAAAEIFASAYKTRPSSATAIRTYRARSSAKLPKPAELLEQWVRQHPTDTVAGMVYAESLVAGGQADRAIAQYELLARDERSNAMVLNNLAWLYHEAGDSRAEATAKRAYDGAPRNGAIADTYGWILVQSGKVAPGLPILEQAVKDAGSGPEVHYHYAVALANAGQRDKARAELLSLTSRTQSFESFPKAQQLLAELGG